MSRGEKFLLPGPNKAVTMHMAEQLYRISKDVIDGDLEIIDAIVDQVRLIALAYTSSGGGAGGLGRAQHPNLSPVDAVTFAAMLETTDTRLQLIGLARWAALGYPQIQTSHTFGAALLATNATEEVIRQAMPPFPSFVLEVPNGLLHITDPETKLPDPIQRVLVLKLKSTKVPEGWTWSYWAFSQSGLTLYRYGVTSLELLPAWIDDEDVTDDRQRNDDRTRFSFDCTDQDKLTMTLLGRLIVNTCLAMNDPTKVKEIGPGHSQWRSRVSAPSTPRGEPKVRVFQVGAPVRHDCREAIAAYIQGDRKSLSVQCLVTGHFKMQPYGPQSTLRKQIWREPFWRGPDDAPIALRSHIIGGDAGGAARASRPPSDPYGVVKSVPAGPPGEKRKKGA